MLPLKELLDKLAILRFFQTEKGGADGQQVKSQKIEVSRKKEGSESREKNKIVFFEGCNLAFDLEDLSSASAHAGCAASSLWPM